jgi:hypothetical protein
MTRPAYEITKENGRYYVTVNGRRPTNGFASRHSAQHWIDMHGPAPAACLTAAQWEGEREMFRDSLLAALDRYAVAMLTALEVPPPDTTPGATDKDLPELFKALDAQFARIMARAGVIQV